MHTNRNSLSSVLVPGVAIRYSFHKFCPILLHAGNTGACHLFGDSWRESLVGCVLLVWAKGRVGPAFGRWKMCGGCLADKTLGMGVVVGFEDGLAGTQHGGRQAEVFQDRRQHAEAAMSVVVSYYQEKSSQ